MRASPVLRLVRPEISRFPCKERACMPGSPTTPGRPSACVDALGHVAFRYTDSVGTREQFSIAAQWLACTYPYRRFAGILANDSARLGADVVRYSFIAVDLHHLLLAGLPAHPCANARRSGRERRSTNVVRRWNCRWIQEWVWAYALISEISVAAPMILIALCRL